MKLSPHQLIWPVAAVAAAVFASGCASRDAREWRLPGNAQAERITDERILAERQAIEALQRRLKALNDAGVPVKNYTHAKAQCWLDSAKTQYHENDRTGYVEQAMEQSIALIRALEVDKSAPPGKDTALIAGSDRLREDLWSRLGKVKADGGFACAAQTAACAEVRLVRAGHANAQTGWRQASPHIAMVEDAVRQAEREAANCPKPTITPVSAASAPAATPTVIAPQAVNERFVLLSDTLFRFDKSDLGNMLPAGKARLAAVARQIKQYSRIDRLVVNGYTDRLGSNEYNLELSKARASTVEAYLKSLGVSAVSVSIAGKGETGAVTEGCSDKMPRAELIACLQPDRRVEIELYGVVK
jgi:outer membrane protein OmpA-like peptidoglycan-associated protein